MKALVIRFSSIGDIVLTTPVLRCLKQQYKGELELHYLTKKKFASLLAQNPYLDRVIEMENGLKPILPMLKAEQYDVVVDLHQNLRTWRVRSYLSSKVYAFRKLNFEKWLLVNFKIDRMPKMHVVDRYMAAIADLGIKNDGKGLDYFLSESDNVALSQLPAQFRNGFVAFAIGGNHATKKLPLSKVITLCQMIGSPIVLIGDKTDATIAQKVVEALGDKVYNACGEFTVNQSASLVKQAQLVLANDTGMMHIASAFKKPIVSMWGNTVPAFGMTPYLPKEAGKSFVAEVKELSCRPCSKIGYDKCPKGHFNCMNQIDLDEIVAVVKSWGL